MKLLYSILTAFLLALFLNNQAYAQANVSVAFVLDESGSINRDDFELETQGFINALSTLPANGNIEISIIGFSDSADVLTGAGNVLLTSDGSNTLQQALSNNGKYGKSGGGTDMTKAIETASQVLLNSSAPSKIICLATDGEPNNESSTTAAAASAKGAGIILAPIGVGLYSSGKTFLDSIASNPPVPNPADFNEFGTVVQNVCVGVVQSALNLELTPKPVDFGVLGPKTAVVDVCEYTETVGLINLSNNTAQITNVSINGPDKDQFKLVTIAGETAETLKFPFTVPRLSNSTTIEVKLLPTQTTPADGSYDAELIVSAVDENSVSADIKTSLVAKYDPEIAGCLNVIDASPTITKMTDNGIPLNGIGNQIQELDIEQALQNKSLARSGLVADGNARLFITVKTNQVSGTVRFTIEQLNQMTEALLYPLDDSPTYGASGDYDLTGKTTLDVQVTTDSLGIGQATAILRAGEHFRGAKKEPEVKFKITACLLERNTCGKFYSSATLRERRAPVVLIHGLWANEDSWTIDEWIAKGGHTHHILMGIAPMLRDQYFQVGFFNYDERTLFRSGILANDNLPEARRNGEFANHGPTRVMSPTETRLADTIKSQTGVCNNLVLKGFACTRADIVAHSMGGLVARKFVFDNHHYRSSNNYEQGAIRRLITLGTPHQGSALANILLRDQSVTVNCLRDDEPNTPGIQNSDIDEAINLLACGSFDECSEEQTDARLVNRGAIEDIAENSELLNQLNSINQNVPTFALFGDIGREIELGPIKAKVVEHQIYDAYKNTICDNGCNNKECVYQYIFGNDNSDGIVPVPSAIGRIFQNETLGNVEHVGMGERNDVATRVIELLNGNLTRFAQFASLPPSEKDVLLASIPKKDEIYWLGKMWENLKTSFMAVMTTVGIRDAVAAENAIRLSVDQTTILPGDTIVFDVIVSGSNVSSVYLTDDKSIDIEDNAYPYQWTMDISKSASGVKDFTAYATIDDKLEVSNTVTVTVMPDISSLNQLVFEPGDFLLLSPGMKRQLRVTGRFNDGHNRNLTASLFGTTYSENIVDGVTIKPGNSSVFSVTSEGEVLAKVPGKAEVVVTNNGITTTRQILVVPAAEGDADGDGVTDVEEDNLGTNKYHPDSDNDGVWDNQENLSQPEPQSSSSSGGGCALNQNADFDPILLILMILSIGYLVSRRYRHVA
jgi:pimeloyl-ACP methyl ester carboxylesterase